MAALLHELKNIFGRDLAEMIGQVLGAAVLVPDGLELALENLGALLVRETGLLEAQLAHVHVVDAGDEQNARFVLVELHLARDPLAVEVRVPEAFFLLLVANPL